MLNCWQSRPFPIKQSRPFHLVVSLACCTPSLMLTTALLVDSCVHCENATFFIWQMQLRYAGTLTSKLIHKTPSGYNDRSKKRERTETEPGHRPCPNSLSRNPREAFPSKKSCPQHPSPLPTLHPRTLLHPTLPHFPGPPHPTPCLFQLCARTLAPASPALGMHHQC